MVIKHKSGKIAVMVIFATLAAASYAVGWRADNPPYEIQDAVVSSIKQETHPSEFGVSLDYVVKIMGSESPIEFSSKRFDYSVKQGDTVDMTVQKGFFGGLEGLSINDHE